MISHKHPQAIMLYQLAIEFLIRQEILPNLAAASK